MTTLTDIVNSHGNEQECLDVIVGPYLGSKPWFVMVEYQGLKVKQVAYEGYWFPELPIAMTDDQRADIREQINAHLL